MNKATVFFFIFLGYWVQAQNGYQINLNFSNLSKDSLEMSYYTGTSSSFHPVSTVSTKEKKATFQQGQKIIGSIYRLNYKGAEKNEYLNIAVDNGDIIDLKIKGDNLKEIETKDPKNALFIKIQNSINREERKRLLQELVTRFPNSVAGLYAELEIKQENTPLQNASEKEKLEYRHHYFDYVDLNDKRIPLLPNIYSSLYDYVRLLPLIPQNYNAAVDHLLKGQNCDSPNYLFYLKWIFMNLEYLSRYKLYDSYIYVFNTYLNKGECILKNEEFYQKTVKKMQNYEKLPIGAIIPDFKMVDKEGNDLHVSDIYPNHAYTFIAFYDPDCPHCKVKMPKINTYFEQLKQNNPVDVYQLAFLNAESDYAWEYFIDKNKLTQWKHVKNEDPNYQYIKDLDVFANPAFFLIDRDGKILLKNFNEDEMNTLFNP